jgi:hypothetical protein
MKKPKLATSEKSVSIAKAVQPIAPVVSEEKTKKPTAQKSTNKPKSIASKAVPEVKAEQPMITVDAAETPKNTSATQKPGIKPKTASPKAKAELSVVSVDALAKPKKATTSQNSSKKAKAVKPKAVAPAVVAATPERASLPSGSIWPNWIENLLGNFGIKKKIVVKAIKRLLAGRYTSIGEEDSSFKTVS